MNFKRAKYFLAHCDNEWEMECFVEEHNTINESKKNAERHYPGINKKWIKTDFKESEAKIIFEKEREKMKCSFCGKSHYDHDFINLITGENANICNICVEEFYKGFHENGS